MNDLIFKNGVNSLSFIFRDGTGPASLFAIVHNALQQLRLDEEVDIFNTVMQIQSRRPDVIASLVDILHCSFLYHVDRK